MEKISQLMDGELEERAARLEIRRLGSDQSLVQAWGTYHLIRDVLRDDLRIGSDFESRLRQQLEAEPTVVAPHTRFASRVVRHTLPLAATVAAVAVVGWLALSSPPRPAPSPIAAHPASDLGAKEPARLASGSASGEMGDYLLAHREFSPTTAIQGVASYVHTVSNEDRDPAR